MIKNLFLTLMLVLFGGCAMHVDTVNYNNRPDLKAFADEDTYILLALSAEEQQQHIAAAGIFEYLYAHAGKNEYKYRELSNYSIAGAYKPMLSRSRYYKDHEPFDPKIVRFEIFSLMGLNDYEHAKEEALALAERTNVAEDYLLISEVYVKQKHYDMAIKYLERAYMINYDEDVLDKMAIILYLNLDRKADAIAYLESHSRLHGCSLRICGRLGSFYSEQNNIKGMLSTYQRLYEVEPKPEVGEAIAKIYWYQKEYLKLQNLLEKHRFNDPMLLQLYIQEKSYAKASALAQELYEKDGDVVYLGQSAIFAYEAATDKHDAKMLQHVMQQLEKTVSTEESGLYLNYLGYLMIDHNINVRKGMAYVKRALVIEPTSAYYLDSMAWGHYKLNECKKAESLMKKVIKQLGTDDPEVKSHLNAIQKCLKR